MLRYIYGMVFLGVLSVLCGCQSQHKVRPNVVLIMADDLGYHDLSCYGHPKIKTPVLDSLAAGGVRLTSFYSGATICTPSRMALMTGAYPTRCGWEQGVAGYLMGTYDGLSPEALTIAEVFKSEGYATGISGKWHIGFAPEVRPHKQGFDFAYYTPLSNNQTRKTMRQDELVDDNNVNRLLTEQFTNEAIGFIKQKKDKPFFLYVPYTAPHFPVEPHPDWQGKSNYGKYGDVVEEMDHRIGDIVKTLKGLDLYKNTIIVFLSDNGPNPNKTSGCLPYRGSKWSALEGGTRVPGIVSWPGVIPAGRQSNAFIAAVDLLPTLCTACEIDWQKKMTGKPPIDGVNVWDTLIGNGGKERTDLLYWHGRGQFHAIRKGDWKLFFEREAAISGIGTKRMTAEQALKVAELAKGEGSLLFNVTDDPGETIDLSDKYPEKVKELQALADKRINEIKTAPKLEIFKPEEKN